jgi:hypothetical protein
LKVKEWNTLVTLRFLKHKPDGDYLMWEAKGNSKCWWRNLLESDHLAHWKEMRITLKWILWMDMPNAELSY